MSLLMVFKGALETDPGWGLPCVIMESGQGTPVPLSPAPSLFCLRLGKGMHRGGRPNACPGAGRGTQSSKDTCAGSAALASLP